MTTSLAAQITRTPRLFDKTRGADARVLLGELTPPLADLIAGAVSASPYLMTLLEKEREWLLSAVEDPAAAAALEIDAAREMEPEDVGPRLRQGKRRIALITALADLGGAWPLEKVTGVLTDFADAACGPRICAGANCPAWGPTIWQMPLACPCSRWARWARSS